MCSVRICSALVFAYLQLLVPLTAVDSHPGFERQAKPFLDKYCMQCHNAKKQAGDFRIDQLSAAIVGADAEFWELVLEFTDSQEMPPKGKPQPTARERQQFSDWLISALDSGGADLAYERLSPEKGNYVPHELLFGPKAKRVPTATPARIWRLSHNAYRDGIVRSFVSQPKNHPNPLTMKKHRGITDYSLFYELTGVELEQMAEMTPAFLGSLMRDKRSPYRKLSSRNGKVPSRELVAQAVGEVFRMVRFRPPTSAELDRYTGFAMMNIKKSPKAFAGAHAGFKPIFLHPEVFFRIERGSGPVDEHGRLQLRSFELANALSTAILGLPTSRELLARVEAGQLQTRQDLERELDAMINSPKHQIFIPKSNDKRTYAFRFVKKLRFVREFFDYHHAASIPKSMSQRTKYGIRSYKPNDSIEQCDTLCAEILHQDRQVLKQLLTYRTPDTGFPALKTWTNGRYAGKGKDRQQVTPGRTVFWKAADNDRYGVLMQKAWLIAHTDNDHNHVIKRGRWVRERLLGGQVPDTPITVDAQLPKEPKATLRHRMRVTREPECWTCHRRMDPIGFVFEGFNHFGYARTDEYGHPLDLSGAITRSGDASLDGDIDDPVALVHKLAESERVTQVFIRHLFRFYLGRNERVEDAHVLQDAYQAYVDSDGSLNAAIRSLVLSDAFLYRWHHD